MSLEQLISAEGTHQGYDKKHKYNLTMEYGATGKILRKTQNNQWRKTDGNWNNDAETTVDYRYSYDGQKPHAVSSITDGVTETLHTFTYDASGNNLLETNSKASSDRQMVWTEDNRLASIKARGNISHYLYDANGIRTLKMSSSSFNISVNGVAAGSSAVDGNFTIYANPYAVVRKNQYTKHYFLGTQRILTKIGNSEVEKTFFEGYAENIVPNVDYQGKQDDLENKLVLNNELLNVGWYRETRGRIPSQHIKHYLRSKEYGGQSGVNPWGNDDSSSSDNNQSRNTEDKQYYFHPDHLGSTNYLTDVTGEAYQHVAYLPWGEVFVEQRNTQSSRNTFLYTGKELDEMTGLYYYEQRYYDPQKSYFLGVDQLTETYAFVSGYSFVNNNPIINVEVDGRWWFSKSNNNQYRNRGNGYRTRITGASEYAYIMSNVNAVHTKQNSYASYVPYIGNLLNISALFQKYEDPTMKIDKGDIISIALGGYFKSTRQLFKSLKALSKNSSIALDISEVFVKSSTQMLISNSLEESWIELEVMKFFSNDNNEIGKPIGYLRHEDGSWYSTFHFNEDYISKLKEKYEKEFNNNGIKTNKENFINDKINKHIVELFEIKKQQLIDKSND